MWNARGFKKDFCYKPVLCCKELVPVKTSYLESVHGSWAILVFDSCAFQISVFTPDNRHDEYKHK